MNARSWYTIVLLSCGLFLHTEAASAEVLEGERGVSDQWGSAWINLVKPRDFHKGDHLKLQIPGEVKKILIRLLAKGADPNEATGIVGGVKGAKTVSDNRVVDVTLDADYANVTQISVHGGAKPWDIDLGTNNGPAKLGTVELLNSGSPRSDSGSESFTYERLQGQTGSSPKWGSGWLDLEKTQNFQKGERLRIQVGGSAEKVVVRILQKGMDPNAPDGVTGGIITIPENRIIEVPIDMTCHEVTQISIHGNPKPWDLYDLGANNGPATISICEVGKK